MNNLTANNEKIGFLEKGAFALANLGNIPIMALVNAFLLIFYTDVVGLNPATVATLFLLARIIDGINDPIIGFIVDHLPKTKMGRFRPYLIIGAIICSLNYLLLWFGPLLFPGAKILIVYISYLLIGITFDFMDIPLNSMIPVMTDKASERNALSSIKGTFYMLGVMGFNIAAPLVVAKSTSPKQGYITLVWVAFILVIALTIIGTLGIKERIQPIEQEKYKFKDIFPIIGLKPVMMMFLTALFSGISMQAAGATGMFFAVYVLGKPEILSIIGLLSIVGMMPGLIVSAALSNKFGKKAVYSVGLFISVIFPLLRLINVTNLPLFYVCTILGSLGGGLTMALGYGIQADNVDYVEWKLNKRAEGALASLNSFVVKAGFGFGGAIPGYVLAATGYVPNAAQSSSAITGIILVSIVIPSIMMLIAGLIFSTGYKIDKKMLVEIEENLNARRAEKSINGESVKVQGMKTHNAKI